MVFLGGVSIQITISSGLVGGVAWFPLAPREIYLPSYPVSRSYFDNVNFSSTVINTTVINNYHHNPNITNIFYSNQRVPGAVSPCRKPRLFNRGQWPGSRRLCFLM